MHCYLFRHTFYSLVGLQYKTQMYLFINQCFSQLALGLFKFIREKNIIDFNENDYFFPYSCNYLERDNLHIFLAAPQLYQGPDSYISPTLIFICGLCFQDHLIVHHAILLIRERIEGIAPFSLWKSHSSDYVFFPRAQSMLSHLTQLQGVFQCSMSLLVLARCIAASDNEDSW